MPISDDSTVGRASNSGSAGVESEACAGSIDRNAPAGSQNSLGAKSDCNGRPTTDDSVVEAMDEEGPITKSSAAEKGSR